ncbi:MAG: hypothetical protein QOF51_4124 [Chloroflexota bacterium]|nr:hypothetical protein [Chloroflexota bacterium]
MPVPLPAWQGIRAFRAAPPALVASEDARRATFDAALRQAEELAEAAAVSGYAAKPLPLFYALSQAGRAIAAARLSDAWTLKDHGLSLTGIDRGVLHATVKPSGGAHASFPRVAQAVGSPGLQQPSPLGALWAANPDLLSVPVPGTDAWPPALRIPLEVRDRPPMHGVQHQDPATSMVSTGGWLTVAVDIAGERASDVRKALRPYPTLRDARPVGPGSDVPDDDPVSRTLDGMGRFSVIVGLAAPGEITLLDVWDGRDAMCNFIEPSAYPNAGRIGYALPEIAGGQAPQPLMLWWALLLGLSSIARYEPAAWTAAIDPSSSVLAVGLERVLNLAEAHMPARVLAALREAAAPG